MLVGTLATVTANKKAVPVDNGDAHVDEENDVGRGYGKTAPQNNDKKKNGVAAPWPRSAKKERNQ